MEAMQALILCSRTCYRVENDRNLRMTDGDNQRRSISTPVCLPSNKTSRPNHDALCIVVLSILATISWIPRFRGPIDLRWDAGVYYVLGTSLAEGRGYRLLNEPGEIRAIQYPPGLPAIIATEELILRSNSPAVVGIWLRRSWFVLSLVYIIFTFLLGRLFLSRLYGLLLAAACLLNYEMYFVSTLAFAELPFALSSTIFGYLYFRKGKGLLTQVLGPLAAVTSYLLRSTGIALLLAWVAEAVLRKQYRQVMIRGTVALAPMILWQSYIHAVESAEHYKRPYYAYQRDPSMFYNVSYATNVALKAPFKPEQGLATKQDLLVRFVSNLLRMPSSLGEAISAKEGFWKGHLARLNRVLHPLVLPSWSFQLALVGLGLIVLAGIAWQLLHHQWFIPLYLLLTIAAICTTTWTGQFPRYLAPVEPFLVLVFVSFLLAVQMLSGRRSAWVRRIASVVTVSTALFVVCESAISCIVGYRNFRDRAVYVDAKGIKREYTLFHYPGAASASERGLQWLVAHADPHAIVAVSMPHWVYLKTGLKTVMPPLEADPLETQRLIDTVPASYVVLDQLLMEDDFNKRFPGFVRNSPEKWHLVYPSPNGEFDIYQRVSLERRQSAELVPRPGGRTLRF